MFQKSTKRPEDEPAIFQRKITERPTKKTGTRAGFQKIDEMNRRNEKARDEARGSSLA
jgi:hypothetical protein